MTPLVTTVYVLAIGAVIGSFLNVVIYRYPRGESVVFPPSHCPDCDSEIRWYDNIPIVSFLFLRGRCRACKKPIAVRYPLVEAANALFYLAVYLHLGLSIPAFLLAALVSMTIVLMYIDAEIQILPDVIDLPGIVVGVAAGMTAASRGYDLVLARGWIDSLLGAALGAAIVVGISRAYYLLRHAEGMGMGDAKMLAMIGSALGWKPVYAVVLIASVTGALFGLGSAIVTGRKDLRFALPFGVFLGFSFLITLFFGKEYLSVILPILGWN